MVGKVQHVVRVAVDDETIEAMKESGAVHLPLNDDGSRVVSLEYLEDADKPLGPIQDPATY